MTKMIGNINEQQLFIRGQKRDLQQKIETFDKEEDDAVNDVKKLVKHLKKKLNTAVIGDSMDTSDNQNTDVGIQKLMDLDITAKPYTIRNAKLGWLNIKKIWKYILQQLQVALKLKAELEKEIALASNHSVKFLTGVVTQQERVFAPIAPQNAATQPAQVQQPPAKAQTQPAPATVPALLKR